jgi:hypothetical protein
MSRSTQERREPIRSHSFTFKSGKYAGYSIGDLMMDDPGYILWLHHNTDFELHADLLDELETSFEEAARNAKLNSLSKPR